MGDWLVSGTAVQNWILVALAITALAAAYSWWSKR
ncbi:MAG: hypothetical protein ACI9P3_004439 [Bradyrhizobium sp.]|jgi:hypothetical protein